MSGERLLLMGDEAVARGAVDAGVGAAYGYPGTPSTEILESLISWRTDSSRWIARWCTNEKVAYEHALGACMAGRRALVTMKHVGLNVAADPFMNSSLLDLQAGLVVAVADDPGMHSSQNEQDSRYFADFSRAICLEPANQQQAYDFTRLAFELSERHHRPVLLRLVTRIAHSRSVVETDAPSDVGPRGVGGGPGWTLLPANARKRWQEVVDHEPRIMADPDGSRVNRVYEGDPGSSTAVVTAGIARNYFLESASELPVQPTHIHIGYYPVSAELLRGLSPAVNRLLVLEDGYPFVERLLPGLVAHKIDVVGRRSGALPATGELTPESVRLALGLSPRPASVPDLALPRRAPQLCRGCPHIDSFLAVSDALPSDLLHACTADIGCYSLGALPPHGLLDSIVCMGASIGMAKGAAEVGVTGVVAVIGDSTFLHSGVGALIEAVEADTPMTVVILDNSTVAMTGGQPTAVPPERLEQIVRGLGVVPEHVAVLTPSSARHAENVTSLRREIEHHGLSVVILRRRCVQVHAAAARRAG